MSNQAEKITYGNLEKSAAQLLYAASSFEGDAQRPVGSVYSDVFAREVNLEHPVYKLPPENKFEDLKEDLSFLVSFKTRLSTDVVDERGRW